jgi:hypothetical protein
MHPLRNELCELLVQLVVQLLVHNCIKTAIRMLNIAAKVQKKSVSGGQFAPF